MSQELSTLQNIYRDYLKREPDDRAIAAYLPILEKNIEEGILFVQQEIIRSKEYETNISLLIPTDQAYINQYNDLVTKGKDFIRDKKIAFIGLARNIETKLNNSVTQIINFAESAQRYKVVIFENDSEDNTRAILHDLAQNNTNIRFMSEDNNRPHFGPVQDTERVLALAEYRNKLKQYVITELPDYDFVVVTDLDFIDFSLPGLYNSFGWLSQFSDSVHAIAGNSYQYKYVTVDTMNSLWNYDSWAFRGSWWKQLPNIPSMTYDRMLWFGFWIMPVGLPIIPVNSAFGGMAIYKKEHFIKGIYDGYDCEHVCFHYSLKQSIPNFQLMLNPSQIMLL